MDVVAMYLFFATAMPLFIWKEYRTFSIIQIPFILGAWISFAMHIGIFQLSSLSGVILNGALILSIIFAHISLILLFFGNDLEQKSFGKILSFVK